MNDENADTLNTETILDNLTHTLLYEGYSLYPYHRSAMKNQKPIPFGVVFPQDYHTCNVHAHSKMQTQCIITGIGDLIINIRVRFLHLIRIALFQNSSQQENAGDQFVPIHHLEVDGKSYQAGWQTIERMVSSGDLKVSELLENSKVIPVEFNKMDENKNISTEYGKIAGKEITGLSAIKGVITIDASLIENIKNAFRITVGITNITTVENAAQVSRNDVLSQSFLSTHTILNSPTGQFISHQSPGEKWSSIIAECQNMNTWPILIDESNTTLLSSPIIVYDHPQINPKSSGDLFDSTEIEEALLLHVAVLSDEEKNRIGQSDGKLKAMLNRVSQVTPEELINFHSGLTHTKENQFKNEKSEL